MAAIAQTIAIVDRSGKVVSTSKQLKNVFFEAKLAYQERKAEIKAERKKKEDRELQKAIRAVSIADDDARSEMSGHRSHRRREIEGVRRTHSDEHSQRGERRERHRSGDSGSPRQGHRSGSNSPRSPSGSPGLAQFNQDLYGTHNTPRSPRDAASGQLLRRSQTESQMALQLQQQQRPNNTRSQSTPSIDMDLAYGEYHDPDLRPDNQLVQVAPEKELSSLVTKCQALLDEANCATYSVKTIITHLQENPDAMAAVALTLAEISNVASKVGPGALMAFKSSAPAVLALLAAPEFLIAVGVGVGITVVMFGGYKIIKKIKEKRLLNDSQENNKNLNNSAGGVAGGVDEMIDVNELDHIERWRRGIANADTGLLTADDDQRSVLSGYSAATSVEGEFISPFAQRSMGHLPLPARSSKSDKDKSKKDKKEKKEREKTDKKQQKKKKRSDENDDNDDNVSNSSKGGSVTSGRETTKQLIKVKKPSPLRRMFVATTAASAISSGPTSR